MIDNIVFKFSELLGTNDFMVLLLGVIGSLFVSINNSQNDKKGVGNFIVGYYFNVLIYMLLSYSGNLLRYNQYIPFMLLVIFHISKSISLAIYCKDSIMLYLSSIQVVLYYFCEMLFTSKLYFTYIYAIIIIFTSVNHIILSVCFLFLQLVMQVNNNFEVVSFEYLFNKLFKRKEVIEFDSDVKFNDLTVLTYILYMEDRDFIIRDTFVFNPLHVIIRKYLLSENKYTPGKEFEIVSRANFSLIYNKRLGSKDLYNFIKFVICSTVRRPISVVSINRGYGTISQQIVRVSALKNFGTYNRFKYRRKIFVEYIYTYYFYKALEKMCCQYIRNDSLVNVDKKNKTEIKKISKRYIKREILVAYFFGLLKKPEDVDALILNMKKEVKTSKSKEDLLYEWENMHDHLICHTIYNSLYWDIFNVLNNEYNLEENSVW